MTDSEQKLYRQAYWLSLFTIFYNSPVFRTLNKHLLKPLILFNSIFKLGVVTLRQGRRYGKYAHITTDYSDLHRLNTVNNNEEIFNNRRAQLLTYLKLSGKRIGLLINFNVADLKEGIHRIII